MIKKYITRKSFFYKPYLYFRIIWLEKIFIKKKTYSQCGEDIFITKFNKKGDEQWTKQYGGVGAANVNIDDEGFSIDVDSSDNLYVTGFTTGGLDNNTSSGDRDYFIMKIDSSSGDLQ